MQTIFCFFKWFLQWFTLLELSQESLTIFSLWENRDISIIIVSNGTQIPLSSRKERKIEKKLMKTYPLFILKIFFITFILHHHGFFSFKRSFNPRHDTLLNKYTQHTYKSTPTHKELIKVFHLIQFHTHVLIKSFVRNRRVGLKTF